MIVDLWILDYYPFTNKTDFTFPLIGTVDLREVYNDENKSWFKWTPEKYVHCIITEVGRAMEFVRSWENHIDGPDFSRQGVIAHKMWKLFTNGNAGWDKELLKGKSNEEINKLIRYHNNRYCIVSGCTNDSVSLHEEYGIYAFHNLPLTVQKNSCKDIKILYTKQELAAIYLMVICEFENMC